MRLVSLSLKGYRQFLELTEVTIPSGLTGICGANGIGKSKLIEAVGFALFGSRNMLPISDKETDLASVSGTGNFTTEVRLDLEVRGQHYRIRRSRKAKDCCIELLTKQGIEEPVATKLASSPSEVTKKVIELFGITPEAYLRTFVARQKEVAGIQSITNSKERQKLINRLIGIAQIERALTLAEGERKQRNATLDAKIADEGDAIDVGLAKEQLSSAHTNLVAAAAQEQACQTECVVAERATQDGRRNKEEWKEKLADVQVKREEISVLNVAANDLETGVEGAKKHYDECLASQTKIEIADQVLEETEGVAEEVETHVTLKSLDTARQDLDQAEEDLKEVRGLLGTREVTKRLLQQIQNRKEEAQAELVRHQEALKTARTTKTEAEKQTALLQARLNTIREMGASAPCELCGQQLGQNLGNALAALTADLDDAKSRGLAADLREQELAKAVLRSEQVAEQLETELDAIQEKLEETAAVPGQMEVSQNRYQSCLQEVSKYPDRFLSLSYDIVSHCAAEEKMQRRTDAETKRQSNIQTAAQRQSAEEALVRTTRLLEQNTARRLTLESELATLADIEIAIQEASAQLEALETKEAAAKTQWSSAVLAKAHADAAVEPAQEKVQQAIKRAEKITALSYDLEVAERTEALLKMTRDEITSESCPRLSEMMDGWARSLMGSHFRRVQLTADYRIEADNGSGMHTIEHFSGGEQTLLAVMLRVAISLYCQERLGMGAGFLVLDEVFGDQDELHRAQLVQFLNEIKPHYHQVLIVNHVADVTDQLGSIIEVTATGEKTSTARLRL